MKNKKLLEHEVLDRASIILDLMESILGSNKTFQKNEKAYKKFNKAFDNMFDCYKILTKC